MGRPRLTVNKDNFGKIYNYIREHVYYNDMTFKIGWAETPGIAGKLEYGVPDFLSILFIPEDPKQQEALQKWCDRYLNAHKNSHEWKKIKDAIRAKRKRKNDKEAGVSKQTLSLEPYAHLVVTDIAEREKATASEVIEKYMGPVFKEYWDKN